MQLGIAVVLWIPGHWTSKRVVTTTALMVMMAMLARSVEAGVVR